MESQQPDPVEEVEGESDHDEIVTMVDVLENEVNNDIGVSTVLGAVDEQSCTYSQGYLPRQPLYACTTCKTTKPAGICLGCTYKCHDGHEFVELYTKRDFRCDCGNSSFVDSKCSFNRVKDATNEKNKYNHNFEGTYCTCKRPYPDPDCPDTDTMLQCVVCEDWFHSLHLETSEGLDMENDCLICHTCMEKLPFLWSYRDLADTVFQNGACRRPKDKEGATSPGAFIWPNGWRSKLCRCAVCLKLFEDNNVSFLLSEEDQIDSYGITALLKSDHKSVYERGLQALSTLDRVKQVEAIHSYNEMKEELMEELKKLKERNEIVRPTHIYDIFEKIKAKKPRLGLP